MISENLQETLYNKRIDTMNILNIFESSELGRNKQNVIITGVTGQDGSYMVEHLLKNTDYEIFGGVRRLSVYNHENISHLKNENRFHLINFDLTDSHAISRVVECLKPKYFINFAAQSFVASSWDFARQTWETNSTAVLDILEAIRQYCSTCRFYNAGCHDLETRIMTPNGLKYYTEMKVGDLVYCINPDTRHLELKPISKIFEYDFDGNLMEFKNGGLTVTPNHTMLYKTKRGKILSKKALDFISLADVKYPTNNPYRGKVLAENIDLSPFIPTPKKKGNRRYGKHISSINSYDLMYLIGLYIGDGSCRIMNKRKKVKCLFGERSRNEVGQFISHPSYLETEFDVEYKCPQCILDIPASDKCFPKVIATLDRNKIKWSLHGRCDITFHQWGLIPYFSECGHSASKKRIPRWIFNLDSSYQLKVLEGIRDSDGDDRNVISTTSKQLQHDLLELHILCGIMPTFGHRPPRSATLKDGRIIKGNFPEYWVHGLKENTGYQRGKWKNIPYKGKVWCFEIENNHNFLVERNGKLTFSGNSSEEFGNVIYSPQDENHPLRPRSPYGASKVAARQIVKVYRESYNLYAVQGWLMNHESERRGEEFVTRKITKGVAYIRNQIFNRNSFKPLELGNIYAKRDWSYAPDFMDGVWKMLNQSDLENIKEYVLASGETHTIKEFIENAFLMAGIKGTWRGTGLEEEFIWSDTSILTKINPNFYRPAEVDVLLGNPEKAKVEMKWTPKIGFKELVSLMVKHDIKKLEHEM